jgi:hypothetical protein
VTEFPTIRIAEKGQGELLFENPISRKPRNGSNDWER